MHNARNMQIIKFKESGKYYDHICLETDREYMFQIVEDFEPLLNTNEFYYVVTGYTCDRNEPSVPTGEHPNGFPCLIKRKNK